MREFNCGKCGIAIRAGEKGVVFIDEREVARRERELQAWKTEGPGNQLTIGAEELPTPVNWHLWCDDCFLPHEAENEFNYWIDLKRIDSPDKALSWTLHLMQKEWFPHTNWSSVMQTLFPLPMDI